MKTGQVVSSLPEVFHSGLNKNFMLKFQLVILGRCGDPCCYAAEVKNMVEDALASLYKEHRIRRGDRAVILRLNREIIMLSVQGDLGEALFKGWTDEQRRDEIGRLVAGYRAGLPVGIVCNMAEKIAGGEAPARRYLLSFMTLEERQGAAATANGGVQELVRRFLGV